MGHSSNKMSLQKVVITVNTIWKDILFCSINIAYFKLSSTTAPQECCYASQTFGMLEFTLKSYKQPFFPFFIAEVVFFRVNLVVSDDTTEKNEADVQEILIQWVIGHLLLFHLL